MDKRLAEFLHKQGEPQQGTKRVAPVELSVKKGTNDNSHVFTISTPDEDHYKDILMPLGADLEIYLKNPVVLWAHDYYAPPIGRSVSVKATSKKIRAEVEYAPTGFAQQIRTLVDTGFLKGSSVGFDPVEWEKREEEVDSQYGFSFPSYIYKKWTLLEWSIVSVPANPFALLEEAKTKGMKVDEIEKIMMVSNKVIVTRPELPDDEEDNNEEKVVPQDIEKKDAGTSPVASPVVPEDKTLVTKPFGPYEDFDDCVSQNQDKDDPEAYCAALQDELESAKTKFVWPKVAVPEIKVEEPAPEPTPVEVDSNVEPVLELSGEDKDVEPILELAPEGEPESQAASNNELTVDPKGLADMIRQVVSEAIDEMVLGKAPKPKQEGGN